mmetsp:Transcript_21235/g.49407  ORF Transcript_21235/g.49407 Transcript_21235/m.49407 type:complete len:259 (+) Transcript_21235:496-1272(+)
MRSTPRPPRALRAKELHPRHPRVPKSRELCRSASPRTRCQTPVDASAAACPPKRRGTLSSEISARHAGLGEPGAPRRSGRWRSGGGQSFSAARRHPAHGPRPAPWELEPSRTPQELELAKRATGALAVAFAPCWDSGNLEPRTLRLGRPAAFPRPQHVASLPVSSVPAETGEGASGGWNRAGVSEEEAHSGEAPVSALPLTSRRAFASRESPPAISPPLRKCPAAAHRPQQPKAFLARPSCRLPKLRGSEWRQRVRWF